jgi:hypothetical protein
LQSDKQQKNINTCRESKKKYNAYEKKCNNNNREGEAMKLANFHDAFDTIKKISTKLARDNDFAMTKKTSKVHKKTTFDAKTNQHSFAK